MPFAFSCSFFEVMSAERDIWTRYHKEKNLLHVLPSLACSCTTACELAGYLIVIKAGSVLSVPHCANLAVARLIHGRAAKTRPARHQEINST